MDYHLLADLCFQDVLKVLSSVELVEPSTQSTSINSIQNWLDCTSFITMRGDKLFYFLAISADYDLLKTMYLNMFQEHLDAVNSDAGDLLGEVCNQTAGKLKTKLSPQGHTFDMCSPVVVFGNNVRVRNLADLSGLIFNHFQTSGRASLFVHVAEV